MKIDTGSLKTCPSCGQYFACQGDEDCWCEKLRIHSREMKIILNTYNDCLCPECLKKYEEGFDKTVSGKQSG